MAIKNVSRGTLQDYDYKVKTLKDFVVCYDLSLSLSSLGFLKIQVFGTFVEIDINRCFLLRSDNILYIHWNCGDSYMVFNIVA